MNKTLIIIAAVLLASTVFAENVIVPPVRSVRGSAGAAKKGDVVLTPGDLGLSLAEKLSHWAEVGGVLPLTNCPPSSDALAAAAAMGFDPNHIVCVVFPGHNNAVPAGVVMNITGNLPTSTGLGSLTLQNASVAIAANGLIVSSSAASNRSLDTASITISANSITPGGVGSVTLSGVTLVSQANGLTPSQIGGNTVSLPGATLTISASGITAAGTATLTITGASLAVTATGLSPAGAGTYTLASNTETFSAGPLSSSGAGASSPAGSSATANAGTLSKSGAGSTAISGSSLTSVATGLSTTSSSATPPTPGSFTLSNSPAQLTGLWNASTGATGYKLYYSIYSNLSGTYDGSSTYSGQTTTSGIISLGAVTGYTIASGLTGSKQYYARVSATSAGGESALASTQSATAAAAAVSFYSSTNDGYIAQSSSDGQWASVHDNSTGSTFDNTSIGLDYLAKEDAQDSQTMITRSFLFFDTSSIGAGKTIISVQLKLWTVPNGASNVVAMKGTQATTLTNADYSHFSGSEYGHASIASSAYTTITFNTQGKSDINLTGVTKICIREYDHDYLNSDPATFDGTTFDGIANSADATSHKPELVVIYQ